MTSEVTPSEDGLRQMVATGALHINLKTSGRLVPFVTAGGGLAVIRGRGPSAIIQGRLLAVLPSFAGEDFTIPAVRFEESDVVTIRSSANTSFVGVLGLTLGCT